jgi:putative hydrolase of the HAD superfamily
LKIKTVLFDIDDTLYDASLQMRNARLNAVRAMIEAGLPVDIESGYRVLKDIVNEHGQYYNKHFDALLKNLGLKWNPRVIAAGVVAYRETNLAYLKPFPDTIPTLLRLRESGYKLGALSDGLPVKQAQKLIQLGIQHFFERVCISEEFGLKKMAPRLFEICLQEFSNKPAEVIFIGNDLTSDIVSANKAGVISVRIRMGDSRIGEPVNSDEKPKYEIRNLSEIISIINKIENPEK